MRCERNDAGADQADERGGDPEERRRLLTFVVVGGNYAGVEVAGELREFLPYVAKRHFPNIPIAEIKVVLVCSTEHILPELGSRLPKLIAHAEAVLAKDPSLEVLYQTRLASATPEEAILGNGRRISTRTIVSCTGMSTIPVLESVPVAKNPHGRLICDRFARIEGHTNLWAGGDCAATGGIDLTVQAVQDGKVAAASIDAYLASLTAMAA